jgi:hypothetical protein
MTAKNNKHAHHVQKIMKIHQHVVHPRLTVQLFVNLMRYLVQQELRKMDVKSLMFVLFKRGVSMESYVQYIAQEFVMTDKFCALAKEMRMDAQCHGHANPYRKKYGEMM